MKNILLLRHAKSDWSNPALADFDRPLAKRGLNDAPRMGMVLVRYGCMPDLVVSSPSLRTRQTVELSVLENGYQGEVRWEDSLYGGNDFDFLAVLQSLSLEVEQPLIVGHNPGVEETLNTLLTPRGDTPSGGVHIRVSTAGLALLNAEVEHWKDIRPGVCVLRWLLVPRLVRALLK